MASHEGPLNPETKVVTAPFAATLRMLLAVKSATNRLPALSKAMPQGKANSWFEPAYTETLPRVSIFRITLVVVSEA